MSIAKPIMIFYVIGQLNHWKDVVQEQIQLLTSSGLYDKANNIYYTLNGDKNIELPSKFNLFHRGTFANHEIETMIKLQEYIQSLSQETYILFIHTKGITYAPTHPWYKTTTKWRQYMEYFLIQGWKECITLLDSNYDTVGVELLQLPYTPFKYYAGTFWWTKSSYLKSLPPIEEFLLPNKGGPLPNGWIHKHRAELWIGQSLKARHKCLYNSGRDLYYTGIEPFMYKYDIQLRG